MRFVSFDPFRTLHIPNVTYVKPEHFLDRLDLIQQAECVLFPPYWLVNSIAYGLGKPIFPSLASYHLGHDKIEMTRVFQAICREQVPQTLILANEPHNQQQVLDTLTFPFVAKTVKSARGQGVFLIQDLQDWQSYCATHDVLYVQEKLAIDRDLRLVVIGDSVVSGYWRLPPPGGFLNNVAQGGTLSFDALPPVAIELVTRLARQLGIDHAGFDVAMVDGHPYLFEFNRLFGNQGLSEQQIKPGLLIHRWLTRHDMILSESV
ncbi:ATP-grasp domain-containing protein [Mangrovitalea sediminis]|uniref:ATP-grasp domain-containing protein n=1 Tax=Mangrovitalea sediminis TaxID=1982043 RepID=UPI000BE50F02|nr:hypothetical protein [Mangrovitalea sediminis]